MSEQSAKTGYYPGSEFEYPETVLAENEFPQQEHAEFGFEFAQEAWCAFESITSHDNDAIYASSGVLFKGARFGRDQLKVLHDLMQSSEEVGIYKKELIENVILFLSSKQGVQTRAINDEKPGRIFHEFRQSIVDGEPLTGGTKVLFDKLSEQWGGDDEEVIYYGSIDATPMYVSLVAEYVEIFGEELLDREVVDRNGQSVKVRECLQRSVDCLENDLTESRSGLLEHKTMNPESGQPNQAWKDSQEAYVHENGEPVNHDAPVASAEVQAYTYDALIAAAKIVPDKRHKYERMARHLQQRTLDLLWMEDKQYFAMGLDYDENGRERQIRTLVSNGAQLLDSNILLDLPPDQREKYVTGISRMIFSDEFMTSAGVRCRALSLAEVTPFWDYHGTFVSWPKETMDIARGFHRHGLHQSAEQLENRVYNISRRTGKFQEYYYIDANGRVLLELERDPDEQNVILVEGTNTPEGNQAWSISSVISILYPRTWLPSSLSWESILDAQNVNMIERFEKIDDPAKLKLLYPSYKYRVWSKNPHQSTFWIDELHAKEEIAKERVRS